MTYEMKIREAHDNGRAEGRVEGQIEAISKTIPMLKKLKLSKDSAIQELMDTYSLPHEKAQSLVNSIW